MDAILRIPVPESCKKCDIWHYCLNTLKLTIYTDHRNTDCPLEFPKPKKRHKEITKFNKLIHFYELTEEKDIAALMYLLNYKTASLDDWVKSLDVSYDCAVELFEQWQRVCEERKPVGEVLATYGLNATWVKERKAEEVF